MTGRAAGYCAGYGTPGFLNPAFGGSWGRGPGFRGGGRGWRHQYYATGLPGWARAGWPHWGAPPHPATPLYAFGPTVEQELEALKAQAEHYSEALEEIRKRIADLESEKES